MPGSPAPPYWLWPTAPSCPWARSAVGPAWRWWPRSTVRGSRTSICLDSRAERAFGRVDRLEEAAAAGRAAIDLVCQAAERTLPARGPARVDSETAAPERRGGSPTGWVLSALGAG
ncbi:hypothetical protein [Amycolatopsis plumensis]|uniref:hypothetical protein n=1 Tax=Amycolatopsis plumensis TaxID=236508 RepID=UPI00360D532C